jgi:arylsulfatase A-like enzyme
MTIPWLAVGPGIRAGHAIQSPVSLLDTAPTIARLLGLTASNQWEGRCVDEIFATG